MKPLDADTVMTEDFERSLAGKKPVYRCPLCNHPADVVEETHECGGAPVTEFLHIECPLCVIVIGCRECHRYQPYFNKEHPCLDLLDQSRLCTCPTRPSLISSNDDPWFTVSDETSTPEEP